MPDCLERAEWFIPGLLSFVRDTTGQRPYLMVRVFLIYRACSDEGGPTMDVDLDGKAVQGSASEGGSDEQVLAQGHQDAQADGGAADYQAALRAKDAQIAELEGRVASAAKTTKATEALNAEIAALKRQIADEQV